jgi:hypothetical protein
MAKTFQYNTAKDGGLAVEGLNDVIKGLNELSQGKEVKKELRGFHKEISKEVQSATRSQALKQSVNGRPVPKRTQGAKGYVGGGTDRIAYLDIRRTNKFVRNLEFGRKYQFLNFYNSSQAKGRSVSSNATGIFFPASELKRRVYKKWFGDLWKSSDDFPEGNKYVGYVAEPTIAKAVPKITENYSEEMMNLIKRSIKENK